mgnify:CR=1 FL=1
MDPLGEFGVWFDRLPTDGRTALAFAVLSMLPEAQTMSPASAGPAHRLRNWLREPMHGNLQLIGRCLTLRAAVDFCFERGLISAVYQRSDIIGDQPATGRRERQVRVTPEAAGGPIADEAEFLSGVAWRAFREVCFSDARIDQFYNCEAEPSVRQAGGA